MIDKKILKAVRVEAGRKISLKDYDTRWPLGELKGDIEQYKERAAEILKDNLEQLAKHQELLYADDRYSLLIVFQAMDAAGKDGTIKHVMSGVNPQGCQVFSFKRPSAEELDHTFLWRCMRALPERGRIGIFNRSHYEDVLVTRVHPEWLKQQPLPDGKHGPAFWKARYEDINGFEQHLARNGTVVLKFFLHVSKNEQKKRFLDRLREPDKSWKFSLGDVVEREYWDEYQTAYEQAIAATSTEWAPWHIVPADHKWVCRAMVAEIICRTLGKLKLRYPEVADKDRQALNEARTRLENE
jgi:PPK2 family polyphosphate:nucleotide phosphotransferase